MNTQWPSTAMFATQASAIGHARDHGFTVHCVPTETGTHQVFVATQPRSGIVYHLEATRMGSVVRGAIRSYWWTMAH